MWNSILEPDPKFSNVFDSHANFVEVLTVLVTLAMLAGLGVYMDELLDGKREEHTREASEAFHKVAAAANACVLAVYACSSFFDVGSAHPDELKTEQFSTISHEPGGILSRSASHMVFAGVLVAALGAAGHFCPPLFWVRRQDQLTLPE